MAPSTVKQYTITGSRWSSQRLEIQQDGITKLYVNANNKYGPWKDPYITIHSEHQQGDIVAAAKMGPAAWARDFKIRLGNPDCTDLETWPVVKCKGKSAFEYRFWVGKREFAWRRTRDKLLEAKRKGHRDFKLVTFDYFPDEQQQHEKREHSVVGGEKDLLDIESDTSHDHGNELDEKQLPSRSNSNDNSNGMAKGNKKANERVIAIYYMDTYFRSNSREAKLNFFEELPEETELWCLTAVLGLQEKISKNQDVLLMSSMSYGGGLWALGNYI